MRDTERRPAPGVVVCQACGAYIGHYVERWNAATGRWETWLALGGAVVDSAHGVCGACGAAWHWSASSRRLERLLGLVRREGKAQPNNPCEGCEQRWYGECEHCELNPKRRERGDER